MKYINTIRDKNHATYTRIEPTFDESQIDISSQAVNPIVGGQAVKMVKATIRLTSPAPITNCRDECVSSVNEAVAVSFNVLRGGENLSALRTEVNRVLDELVGEYQLANGVVPPSTADFKSP